jgi:hypothetical protein
MAVEIGRAICPPDRSPLAQHDLGTIHGFVRIDLDGSVSRAPRAGNRPTRA